MKSHPVITIRRISLHYARYFDWLVTGLGELAKRGEIEYRCDLQPLNRLMAVNGPRWLLRRIFPKIFHEISGGPVLEGTFTHRGKSVTFCYDVDDRPFWFDLNILEGVDLYFKAQFPRSFPEPFRLSRDILFNYPATVLDNRKRIFPAMLGRPLARSLNAEANRKVLEKWQSHGKAEPSGSLFAYFGGAAAEMARPMAMELARRQYNSPATAPSGSPEAAAFEKPALFGHPNQKRLELVKLLRAWNDPKVDARLVSGPDPSLIGPSIPRQINYARKLAEYDWNCNISGFYASIPFRFADAFSLGRGIVTDELLVKWYEPFDETEVRSLGPIGYELSEDVDWARAEIVLRKAREDSDVHSANERRTHIRNRFETLWSPGAFADYLVKTCLSVL